MSKSRIGIRQKTTLTIFRDKRMADHSEKYKDNIWCLGCYFPFAPTTVNGDGTWQCCYCGHRVCSDWMSIEKNTQEYILSCMYPKPFWQIHKY